MTPIERKPLQHLPFPFTATDGLYEFVTRSEVLLWDAGAPRSVLARVREEGDLDERPVDCYEDWFATWTTLGTRKAVEYVDASRGVGKPLIVGMRSKADTVVPVMTKALVAMHQVRLPEPWLSVTDGETLTADLAQRLNRTVVVSTDRHETVIFETGDAVDDLATVTYTCRWRRRLPWMSEAWPTWHLPAHVRVGRIFSFRFDMPDMPDKRSTTVGKVTSVRVLDGLL